MPRAISVPPSLNMAQIPAEGAKVTVTEARVVRNQWTTIGTTKLGLGLTVKYKETLYSQLFSTDKDIVAGSIGRILVSMKVEDVTEAVLEKVAKDIVGKQFNVVKKGEKVYWYP